MTQPVSHGYPDFGRYVATADKELLNLNVADIDAQTNYGPVFVGDVPWLGIFFLSSGGAFTVQMRYGTQPNGTGILTTQSFTVESAGIALLSFPVGGPYLTLRVTPQAINGVFNAQVYTQHSPAPTDNSDTSSNIVLSSVATAVGAGATVTVTASRVFPGPAVWNVFTTLATWEAHVRSHTAGGSQTRLDTVNQAVAQPSRMLYLPYEFVRVAFTNNTGAAGTFNTTIVTSPSWPMGGR